MTPLEELSAVLSGGSRVILIAERDVNLKTLDGDNRVFVLRMVEGSLAAGGRGAGLGERRVTKVMLFRYHERVCEKLFETEDEVKVAEFEVPYYVSRIPFTLADGGEAMGYGVVDPDLVASYIGKTS